MKNIDTEFNTTEFIDIVTKADDEMIRSTNMLTEAKRLGMDLFDGKRSGIDFLGLSYYHFIATLTLHKILKESARSKEGTKQFAARIANMKNITYSEMGAYFSHKLKMAQGKVLNSYQWLREAATSRGKVYFQTSPHVNDPYITVFTAHFFDQFAIRTGMCSTVYEAQRLREQAIYAYMESKTCFTTDEKILGASGDIAIGTEKGLCLGVKLNKVMLIKTFVSNDMLKGKQPILAEETSEELFKKFNDRLIEDAKYEIDELGTRRRKDANIGRNDPCSCGSNKKFKKCCG